MRIGLTYDLRAEYLAAGYGEEETAEFDRPDTIDAIDSVLRSRGHETDRIGHARHLLHRLAAGHRWDLVFNIAEGLRGYGREALIPALLEAHDIPCTFSDPMVLALALHKGMCKRVVRDLGIPTPAFAAVESEADAARVSLDFPLFVKPIAEGTSKGCNPSSKVARREDLWPTCRRLIEQFRQPALVEEFLPGREVTVGLLGTADDAEAIGTIEVVLLPNADADVYSFRNKEQCEELVKYQLADGDLAAEAEALALRVWRGLGCRDAGRIDLRADARGSLSFIELNPLPGLNPVHSDLPILCGLRGLRFESLIDRILDSAMKRLRPGGGDSPRPFRSRRDHSGARDMPARAAAAATAAPREARAGRDSQRSGVRQ